VEVPPEEPTLTAQIDVRAALAKVDAEQREAADIDVEHEEPEEPRSPADVEDRTVAGAVAVLVASEQPPSSRRPSNTLPFVAPSDLPDAPPSSQRVAQEPPSPRASRASSGAIADDSPVDIPGLGAQRRGMRTIVLSVLAACALVCAGALARHLWPEGRKDPAPSAAAAAPPPASSAAATGEPSPAAASSAATAEPSPAPASPSPTAAISAAPSSSSPTAAITATAEPSPAAASGATTAPSPAAASSAAPSPTAVAVVAPNASRPAERRPLAPRPAARPAGPARPGARGAIVRDAPF
jgi:hypothetical protein